MKREVYTVLCMTGGYEGWDFYDVATFSDKALANELAGKAQQVADDLIKRFGAEVFGMQGLNPHDPRMSIEPGRICYTVRSQPVLDRAPEDPAGRTGDARIQHYSASLKVLPDIATPLQVALEYLEREYEPAEGLDLRHSERSVRATDVLLASVQFDGHVYDLILEGEFAGKPWDEEKGEYSDELILLSSYSEVQRQALRECGKPPEDVFWDEALVSWRGRDDCDFWEHVPLLATTPHGMVGQLLRLLCGAALRS